MRSTKENEQKIHIYRGFARRKKSRDGFRQKKYRIRERMTKNTNKKLPATKIGYLTYEV